MSESRQHFTFSVPKNWDSMTEEERHAFIEGTAAKIIGSSDS